MKESGRKYQVLTQEQRAQILAMKSEGMKNKEISIKLVINLKTVASVKSPTRKSEYGEIKQALLYELKKSNTNLRELRLVKRKIREIIVNAGGKLKQIIDCFNKEKNQKDSKKRNKNKANAALGVNQDNNQQISIKMKIIEKQADHKQNKNLEFTTQNRKIIEWVAQKYLEDTNQEYKLVDQMIEEQSLYESSQSESIRHEETTEFEFQIDQLSSDVHRQEPFIPVEEFLQESVVPLYDIWGEIIKNGSEESFMNSKQHS